MDQSSKKIFYLKQFAKTSFFVFFAVIISKLLSYGFKISLARYFGPEVYGLYSLGLIIIGIFAGIGSLGLAEGLTRYLSQYYEKQDYLNANKLIKKAIILGFFVSILFAIIFYSAAELISINLFHNANLTYYLQIFAIALPFVIISNLLLATIRARQKIKTYSFLVNISQNALKLIFIFLLILVGFEQKAVPISYLFSTIGLFILTLIFFKKLNKYRGQKYDKDSKPFSLQEVLLYSWPIALVSLLYGLLYWVDSLVIGYFGDASLIGTYNVAITIVSLFGIAPDLFINLLFPFVSGKLVGKKDEIIRDVSTQIVKWIFLVNIPLLFFIALFPETVIRIIFGSDFVSGSQALRILTISGMLTSFISIFTNLISAIGKTRVILFWFLTFTGVNFGLAVYLVPDYGLIGAATATAVSSILFFLASFTYVKKQYSFYPINRALFRSITYCLILIAIFFTISEYLTLDSMIKQAMFFIVFLIVYAIMIFYSKTLNSDDFEIVRSTFRKILRK